MMTRVNLAGMRSSPRVAWWMATIPGATIVVTVLAINLFSEGF